MFSFPLVPPPFDTYLLFDAPFRPRPDSPPPPSSRHPNGQQQQQHHLQHQSRRDEERKAHNARSPLALLAIEEAAIEQRKVAIRNFGAHWIRPPGVLKTLQATMEEAAEQAEQEELLRQEQGLRDMQAQQQLEETRARAAETATVAEDGGDADDEIDLDDDIPDAETSAVEEVTFNDDSIVEGSHMVEEGMDQEQYAELEEAELTGAAQDEEDLGIEHERDLDDSVPEAGSYQHTDSELEDSSSESELQDSFAAPSARRSAARPGRPLAHQQQMHGMQIPDLNPTSSNVLGGQGSLQERLRAQTAGGTSDGLARSPGSWNLSSSLTESSFVGSSPVMQRGGGHAGRRTRAARRRERQS